MNWIKFKQLVEAAGVKNDTEIFFIDIENENNDEDVIVLMLEGCNGFYVRQASKEEQVE